MSEIYGERNCQDLLVTKLILFFACCEFSNMFTYFLPVIIGLLRTGIFCIDRNVQYFSDIELSAYMYIDIVSFK